MASCTARRNASPSCAPKMVSRFSTTVRSAEAADDKGQAGTRTLGQLPRSCTHTHGARSWGACSLVSTRMHGLPTTRHLMLADSNPVAGWMVSG